MSTALQLQFFMVQAVNYSGITVRINCEKNTILQIKALTMVKLINTYNFCFTVNVFHHT